MTYETLLYEKADGIGLVTLNRPERLNALSYKMREELAAVFDVMEKDDEVKVVILTGGPKAFSAGADIKERSTQTTTQPAYYFIQQKTHQFFTRIENFEKVVIAAVSGVAVGGGCELSLVCDLRIASETARFGVPEVKIGVIPAAGGTQRLPRIIGVTKAKELLYTGDFIDAQEAYRVGLVNRVVPVEELLDAAKAMAGKLIANPPLPVKFLKRAVNTGMQLDLASALDYESYIAAMLACSEDRIEGFKAFVEKRKPVFKGC
ncbi:MAG: enoyl-CoA hydratase/isomerase family protein [Proteobacteria bacterium]|nr:enoyl-CoA hydratase/isomerase family protein [Pseudomonadota bacterium]